MKSKFMSGKKINIFSRQTIKSRIDQLLISEFQHLNAHHQLKLQPSKKEQTFNCSTSDNNNLIMRYINSLYDEYNIPDPLNPSLKEKQISSSLISHPSEAKQTPKKKGIRVSKIVRQTEKKRNSTLPQKVTGDENRTKHHHTRKTLEKCKKSITFIYKSPQNQQKTDDTEKNEENSENNRSSQISEPNKPIEQSYRYCIGCQDAVLVGNMKYHEVKCGFYRKIYQMNLKQISSYLQMKIDEIRDRMKRSADCLKKQDEMDIKLLSSNIYQSSKQIQKNGQLNNDFIANYNEVMKIGRSWSFVLEQLQKLKWFLRIKHQINKSLDH